MGMFAWLQKRRTTNTTEENRSVIEDFTRATVKAGKESHDSTTAPQKVDLAPPAASPTKDPLHLVPPEDSVVDPRVEDMVTKYLAGKSGVSDGLKRLMVYELQKFCTEWGGYVAESQPGNGANVEPPDSVCCGWMNAWFKAPRPATTANHLSQPVDGRSMARAHFFSEGLDRVNHGISPIEDEHLGELLDLTATLEAFLKKPVDYGAVPDANAASLLPSMLNELAQDARQAGIGDEEFILNLVNVARAFWSRYNGVAAPTAALCSRVRCETMKPILKGLIPIYMEDKPMPFCRTTAYCDDNMPTPTVTGGLIKLHGAYGRVFDMESTYGCLQRADQMRDALCPSENMEDLAKLLNPLFQFNEQQKAVVGLGHIVVDKLPQ